MNENFDHKPYKGYPKVENLKKDEQATLIKNELMKLLDTLDFQDVVKSLDWLVELQKTNIFLTPEERKEILQKFEEHGYTENKTEREVDHDNKEDYTKYIIGNYLFLLGDIYYSDRFDAMQRVAGLNMVEVTYRQWKEKNFT